MSFICIQAYEHRQKIAKTAWEAQKAAYEDSKGPHPAAVDAASPVCIYMFANPWSRMLNAIIA